MLLPFPVRRRVSATLISLLSFAGPLVARAQPTRDPGLARLGDEIQRLSAISRGTVGVGIVHLESGRELFINRDEPFPMASTFKVPVAVQILTLVDSGKVRLDSMVTVAPSDLHPGSGTLTSLFNKPGVSLSIRNIMELMLLISDNSAADILLRTAGRGPAVNARLAALGVRGISVDRPTVQLIADALGVKNLPPENELTPERFRDLMRAVTPDDRTHAADTFSRDRRDTSTPEGMARLLEKVWRRQALSPASTDLLLDIMRRCQTGPGRIKGMLPPEVVVMHKTGTLNNGITDDVGILTLPNDAGHLVLTVFVKDAKVDEAAQERTIAQIARAAYDYFVFNVAGKDSSAR